VERCPLGHTELSVSPIGLGTVKLGRTKGLRYPPAQQAARLPNDAEVLTLLTEAHKLGTTLIDTAPAYGLAEERLGSVLYTIAPRAAWQLCSKAGEEFDEDAGSSTFDYSPAAITRSIDRSLRRLKTDYLDIALLHFATGQPDEWVLAEGAAYAALKRLQEAGKARAIGASPASLAGGLLAVDLCEVAMLTLNTAFAGDLAAITQASITGCGVMIKKPLASGHAAAESRADMAAIAAGETSADPIQRSLKLALAPKAVACAIVGTSNPAHLRQAVLIAELLRGS